MNRLAGIEYIGLIWQRLDRRPRNVLPPGKRRGGRTNPVSTGNISAKRNPIRI